MSSRQVQALQVFVVMLIASLILLACPPGPTPTDVIIDVAIGISSSGGAGALGRVPGLAAPAQGNDHWLYEAVRLAVAQMTEDGTLQLKEGPARVKLIFVDDQGDPLQAEKIAQGLVKRGVVAVIGHLTPETALAAARVYAQANVLYMSPVVSTQEMVDLKTTHLMQATPLQVASASARAVYYALEGRRVAVLMQADEFHTLRGKIWAETFTALGGEIVLVSDIGREGQEIDSLLRAAAERGAQAIVYSGDPEMGARLTRAVREMGLPLRVIGFEELVVDPFLELAGPQAEGTIAFTSGLGEQADIYLKYREIAAEAGISALSPNAPYAYDAARFVLEAVQTAGSNDPSQVSKVAFGLEVEGLTGPIAFSGDGRRQIYQVTLYEVTPEGWMDKVTLTQPSDSLEPGEWVPNGEEEPPPPLTEVEGQEDWRPELLEAYRRLRDLRGFRREIQIPDQIYVLMEIVPAIEYAYIFRESYLIDTVTEILWLEGEGFVLQDNEWVSQDPESLWPIVRFALVPDEVLAEQLTDAPVQREGPVSTIDSRTTIARATREIWIYRAEALWLGEVPAYLTVAVDVKTGWPLAAQWTDQASEETVAQERFFDHDQEIEIIQP